MFKKQLNRNIDILDGEINTHLEAMTLLTDETERELAMSKLEQLTDLRTKLEDNRTKGSIKPLVVSGAFGLASVALVLKYEETGVITSKAFNMATSMIRGSK